MLFYFYGFLGVLMVSRRILLVLVLVIIAASVGGYIYYQFLMPRPPAKPKRLIIAISSEPDTLDISKMTWATTILADIYDTLVTQDPVTLEFKDGLAERWEVSEDGLKWTFYLKKDARFHDGTPVNASAIAWSLMKLKEGPSAYMVDAIEKIETPDPYTLVFIMKRPDANLLWNLATVYMCIMSPSAYQKYGEEYGTKYAVGSGPFILKEWIKGERMVVVRNPEYKWGPSWCKNRGPAYIDEIVYRIVPEETTRIMMFEAREVDMLLEVPPHKAKEYEKNPDVTVLSGPGYGTYCLWFNHEVWPWNTTDGIIIKKAIAYAIDREAIAEHVFFGYADPAYVLLPPVVPEHDIPEEYHFKYDPEYAKKLLEEAGWIDVDGDGVREKNGRKLILKCLAHDASEIVKTIEVVQEQLAKIGIKIEIEVYDWTTFHDKLRAGVQQMYIRWWYWPNADILDWFFHSRMIPFPNHSRFNDTEFDRMLEYAMKAPTWEERVARFKNCHIYAIQKVVWVPIVYPRIIAAFYNYVTGVKMGIWGVVDIKLDWDIKPAPAL